MAAGIALLLLLAPDDPAQILRVAWASQYEWKEDKVESATIDFAYSYAWGEKGEFTREGQGQVVVAGNAIVRRHYPDITDDAARARLDGHVHWVLARFVRRPFEEEFRGARFAGPEKSAYDQLKITVNDRARYVKDDRLVAEERSIDVEGKPLLVRVDFKTEALGGGYAILGEGISYTRKTDSMKVVQERTLTTRIEGDRPAPAIYTFEERSARDKEKLTLDFHTIRFDLPEPVTLDPAARDLLKEAWGRRLVLPEEIRIQGHFQRTVDRELDRAGWSVDVRGDFQVWGMDSIQVALDEDQERTRQTCEDNIRWLFGLLRDTPFEREFQGCGFEKEPQGDETVIRVYGYPKALAFRIAADGVIVGHYQRQLSEPGWWTYRTKSAGDGRFQIDRMKRDLEGKKIELEFDYQRVRGYPIPKKCGVLEIAPSNRGGTAVGIAEYVFKKPKVSFPNE